MPGMNEDKGAEPIIGLDHVALGVPDVELFIGHLTGTFGMEVVRRGEHHETGRPIAFVKDAKGSKLELIEADVEAPTFLHAAFAVPDAEAAHESLLSSGFSSSGDLVRLEAAKANTAFEKSPEGLEVQVVAFDEEA